MTNNPVKQECDNSLIKKLLKALMAWLIGVWFW